MHEADPFSRFEAWLSEAREREGGWAEVMTLATAGRDGRPSARAVVLTGCDERGLVFFTDRRLVDGAWVVERLAP